MKALSRSNTGTNLRNVLLFDRSLTIQKKPLINTLIKFTLLPALPLLVITFLSLNSTFWIGSEIHHFYIELFAVVLVSVLAFYYILRARILKDEFSLFVGIGFLISGLIDLLHVIVSFTLMENISFLKYFIPQTWFAGRIFLSAMLLIAVIKYSGLSKEEGEGEDGEQDNPNEQASKDSIDNFIKHPLETNSENKSKNNLLIYIIILSIFASSIALSSLFLVFPAAVLDDYSLHRPYEIPPLILLSLTLLFFYKKRLYLKEDIFYKGIIAYLIVDIFAQTIMSFSATSFDTAHNIAHVLKDVGYFVNIIALVLSSIQYSVNLKENNDLIKRQYKKVKETEKIKDDFINIAAHELRTPIQPIIGLAGRLNDAFQNKEHIEIEELETDMTIIYRNANKLHTLTNDILDVTKIESNALKLDIMEFDIIEVISNTVRDGTIEIEKKKKDILIACKYDFNNHFKLDAGKKAAISESIIVKGDKSRIIQVLSNLLNNAIKFTDKGSISITIETRKKIGNEGAKEIVIRVEDTGHGIIKDKISNLFEKFFTDSTSGTGLGLYISKSIVEAHGGRIWAENNMNGIGATVSFSIPLAS
jgi:signal transduction histidine kinase